MQMCKKHWDELKDAIKARGLEHLIAKNGEDVIERLQSAESNPESFEPLMAAHNMIISLAMDYGGIYMMLGDYCPLCELEKHTTTTAQSWIDGAADDCYRHAVEVKLITVN